MKASTRIWGFIKWLLIGIVMGFAYTLYNFGMQAPNEITKDIADSLFIIGVITLGICLAIAISFLIGKPIVKSTRSDGE